MVRVREPADLAAVEEQIKNMGFQTSTMLSHFKEMRTFLIFLQVLLGAVGTVALVVAALGIVNTLLMAVLERYQEIGICKAIGASDGDILVLFLTEAGMLGLLGGLGGLLLGRVVSSDPGDRHQRLRPQPRRHRGREHVRVSLLVVGRDDAVCGDGQRLGGRLAGVACRPAGPDSRPSPRIIAAVVFLRTSLLGRQLYCRPSR